MKHVTTMAAIFSIALILTGCGSADEPAPTDAPSNTPISGASSSDTPATAPAATGDMSDDKMKELYAEIMARYQYAAWERNQNETMPALSTMTEEQRNEFSRQRASFAATAMATARDDLGVTMDQWRTMSKLAGEQDWYTELDATITARIEELKTENATE